MRARYLERPEIGIAREVIYNRRALAAKKKQLVVAGIV